MGEGKAQTADGRCKLVIGGRAWIKGGCTQERRAKHGREGARKGEEMVHLVGKGGAHGR
jgi:hypothetical protein